MQHEIMDAPDFGLVKFTLEAGEKVVAESGAMVAMSPELDIETSMRGGMLAAAKRKFLGGESLFQYTYTAKAGAQELYLAAAPEGDLRSLDLAAGESFFLQSGAYVAHVGDELDIVVWVKRVGGASVEIAYRIECRGTLVVTAETAHAMVDSEGRPRRIPRERRQNLARLAGGATSRIQPGAEPKGENT